MKKLLLSLALLFAPSAAWAQCNGVFGPQTLCGNLTGTSTTPKATSTTSMVIISPTLSGATLTSPTINNGNATSIIINTPTINTATISGSTITSPTIISGTLSQSAILSPSTINGLITSPTVTTPTLTGLVTMTGSLSIVTSNSNIAQFGNGSLAGTNNPTSIALDSSFANSCGSNTQNKIYLLGTGLGAYGIGVCSGQVFFDSGGSFAWYNNGSLQTMLLSSTGGMSLASTLNVTSVSTFNAQANFTSTVSLSSSSILTWNNDTGLSRATTGNLILGNGTTNDRSGALNLAQVAASFNDKWALDINSPAGLKLNSTSGVYWAVDSNWFDSLDTGISRDAAGVIDFGTGTQGSSIATLQMSSFTLGGTPQFTNFSTGASTQTFTNSPCAALTTERWLKVKIVGSTSQFFVPACS